jgi:hypothetical protein
MQQSVWSPYVILVNVENDEATQHEKEVHTCIAELEKPS